MINSRNIDDLHPFVALKAKQWKEACERDGMQVIITSTYRDDESQSALYAIGRTTRGADPIAVIRPMGRTVTNARAGYSFHNYRIAFDFVPLEFGKPAWNNIALFTRCGEIGELLGLEWAGRWKSFREYAHLQYTGGLTLADLRSGTAVRFA